MRFLLILILATFSVTTQADSLGLNVGFGQGTRPFYGVDYQVNADDSPFTFYLDASLYVNQDYVQPGLSGGLQLDHVNIGLATSLSGGKFCFGPEIGWTQNLSNLFFIKVGNSYTGPPGSFFNYSATFSAGVNF